MGSIPCMLPWWGALKVPSWQATEQTKIFLLNVSLSIVIIVYIVIVTCFPWINLILVHSAFQKPKPPKQEYILTLLFSISFSCYIYNSPKTKILTFIFGNIFVFTGDILNLHQSIWLSKKYIKLNWSGDSIYSQNFRGATQAHVREISFGEVMRWSLLPTDTELHQMYERQRIVFGIFCSNRKLIQKRKRACIAYMEKHCRLTFLFLLHSFQTCFIVNVTYLLYF